MPENVPDFEKMQRDAERRLKEMQQRSNRAVHGTDIPPVPNFAKHNNQHRPPNDRPPKPQNQHNNPPPTPVCEPPSKSGILSKFKGLDILKILNFQNFSIDNDVLVILALIFLLSTDETDELLLLALVYIML